MIFVADNANTDGTFEVVQAFVKAKGLESEIRILREPTPGKNIALKTLINHIIKKGYDGQQR